MKRQWSTISWAAFHLKALIQTNSWRLPEIFLRNVPEYLDPKDFEKIQKQKAKIVSVLAQTLYIMCALSKEQIKNITKFWKAMMSFISPESEQVVKKIHVSYSGCVLEAQKRLLRLKQRFLKSSGIACTFHWRLTRHDLVKTISSLAFHDSGLMIEFLKRSSSSRKSPRRQGNISQDLSLKNLSRKLRLFKINIHHHGRRLEHDWPGTRNGQ